MIYEDFVLLEFYFLYLSNSGQFVMFTVIHCALNFYIFIYANYKISHKCIKWFCLIFKPFSFSSFQSF